jgi:hypothetical protein
VIVELTPLPPNERILNPDTQLAGGLGQFVHQLVLAVVDALVKVWCVIPPHVMAGRLDRGFAAPHDVREELAQLLC